MHPEQKITIQPTLSPMHRCRQEAESLFGDSYPAVIEKYKALIRTRMKEKKLEVPTATYELIQERDELRGETVGEMLLMAAGVEMVEKKC
jgi:effector-binding domain-containing protein